MAMNTNADGRLNLTRAERSRALRLGVSGAVLAAMMGLAPQAVAADADAPAASATDVSELIVVGKRNDRYNVLPDRETGSVFGAKMSIAEIPRSVTVIEAPLISLFGIRNVNDFVNITPGSFTSNYFGVPGSLSVRGERADNFFRGFRRIENNGNFPTSVQAADYVEIIKGPPPVIYGGGKVGGVLNFVPKGPTRANGDLLDAPTGLAAVTLGTYGKRQANLEARTPFSLGGLPSAVYVSLQGEDSDSYYRNVYSKNLLLQVSAKTLINDKLSVEYGGMMQWVDLNQSLGWNRVTQDLIDSDGKHYLAGHPTINLDTNNNGFIGPSEVAPYQLGQFAFMAPFPYYALSAQQRQTFALDPASLHTASLSHRDVLTDPVDFAKSDVYTGYFDLYYDLGGGWSAKNQTFYDRMKHRKYSSYGFTADYKAYAVENKTTLSGDFKPANWLSFSPVLGASYRKSAGREQEGRDLYQVEDRRDLSVGATGNDRFERASDKIGGVPFNWDQQGRYTDAGAFALLTGTLADRLTGVFSARFDRYHVAVHGTDNAGVYGDASDSKSAWTYNASLGLKLTPTINAYGTYSSSRYLELGQGGFVGRPNIDGDTWIQPSKLYEFGLKGYLHDGRLYFNAVHYQQEKSSYDVLGGFFDKYRSKGVEVEAHYALTKALSFIATGTWQKTTLLNAPFFNAIPPAALGLDPALTYGGKLNGVGSLIGVNGPLDVPMPDKVFSATGTYTDPSGWGVSLGATHASSMWAGYTHLVRLPQYTVVRGAAFYNFGKWSAQVNADNLLNEHYFTPQHLFWDVLVSPNVGRTVNLTLTRRW